jgi:hypothetical protein
MKFSQLRKESNNKTLVFAYGRFNPPGAGHKVLIDKVQKEANLRNSSSIIFLSPTQDSKKNPLMFEQKYHFMREMFPLAPVSKQPLKSIWEALMFIGTLGFKHVVMVAGGDRVDKYLGEFSRYLNHPDESKRLNFETFEVVNAGMRDPDGDGPGHLSASMMREAAKQGNFGEFIDMTPHTFSKESASKMMNEVRSGMELAPIFEEPSIWFFRRDEPPKNENPEPDPGLYSSFSLSPESSTTLYNWALKNDIPNIVPTEKMHCTVVWSPKHIEYPTSNSSVTLDPDTYSFAVLGDALVLQFNNHELQQKWNLAKQLGAEFTFPTYKQHITISYDPGDVSITSLKLPDFPIILDSEKSQTLKEIFERKQREKMFDYKNDPLIDVARSIMMEDPEDNTNRHKDAVALAKKKKKAEIIINPELPNPGTDDINS